MNSDGYIYLNEVASDQNPGPQPEHKHGRLETETQCKPTPPSLTAKF
jgi:hypothetical protein